MKPFVTFVAVAHNEERHNCPFVDSMLNQKDQNFNSVVWHNGSNVYMSQWIEGIDQPWTEEHGNKVGFKESKHDTGNWGTANRQQAIDECTTDYIIQTSVQDYWLPEAVSIINKLIEQHKPDLILWNSINHVVGPCLVLDSKLAWSKVDWGNFAIRTDIAKYIGIRHGDKYTADWLFVNDVLTSGLLDMKKVIKTSGILTCHN